MTKGTQSEKAADRDSLRAVVPQLVLATNWSEMAPLLERHDQHLRSDEALGLLAVMRIAYNDRSWQERIDGIRLGIEEGRDDGHVGVPRPLTRYFEDAYGPDGLATDPVFPDGEPFSGLDAGTQAVALAFLAAPSWRVRRHIYAAYPAFFTDGEMVGILQALSENSPHQSSTYNVLIKEIKLANQTTQDRRFMNSEPCFFGFAGDPPQVWMTESETRDSLLVSYVESPTWERRREVLAGRQNLLVCEESVEILDAAAQNESADEQHREKFRIARDHLAACVLVGLDDAFSQPLPATMVRIPAPIDLTDTPSQQLGRTTNLRLWVNYTDPDLTPWIRATLSLQLADDLISHPHPQLRPRFTEEALLRAHEARTVFGDSVAPEESRRAAHTMARAYLARHRGDRSANLEAAIDLLENALKSAIDARSSSEAGPIARP